MSVVTLLLLVAVMFAGNAWADGTKASTARNAKAAAGPRTHLCFNDISSPDCRATLARAVGGSIAPSRSFRQPLEASDAHEFASRPELHFQKRAYWVRRLESIAKEGIPFARFPQSHESELVIGINRKGMLGFTLKQKDDDAP
jgi:hypothetical protein